MKIFLILVLSNFLIACGPVYETKITYITPVDVQGKSCAAKCESDRSICQQICDNNHDTCMRETRLIKQNLYLEEKNQYLEKKNLCKDKDKDKSCQNLREPYMSAYVSDSDCRKDCSCQMSFERCFEICGGKVLKETRCVSDCDK
jgi:hypothetical protein